MTDKKIFLLMFLLSMELLMIGVFTLGNSFAIPTDYNNTWDVGYIVDGEKENIINIDTELSENEVFEKEIEIYNDGNIDAMYNSMKIIGDTTNLDVSIDNIKETLFSHDKYRATLKIKLKDNNGSSKVDIGVSLLFKELN